MAVVTTLVGFATAVLAAVLAAAMARRILGVPVGWPRSIIVGIVVLTSLVAAYRYVLDISGLSADPADIRADPAPYFAFSVLATVWVFLFGLVALVLLELFLPTGTVPTPRSMLSGWRGARRRARPYTQITAIAVRHGLGGYLRGRRRTAPREGLARTARSLTAALNDAGVVFIKFGQMLSTRGDLVPEVFVRELANLQTRAEPEPWPQIQAAIEAALGRPLDEVFVAVDPAPLAAASVAQVHQGRLRGGEEVVLKVQRPGAQRQVAADVDILLRFSRWLERTTAWAAALGIHRLAEGFAASLAEELDYTIELNNMRGIANGHAGGGGRRLRVPAPFPEHSSRTLLVMERLVGTPVADAADRLAAFSREQRREIAERLVGEVLRQVTVTGVFHADLHMGNVLIGPDHELAMLDFGSVGRLDTASRGAIGMLLLAIERNDSVAATDALIELLERPDELAERRLEREVGQLILRYRSGFAGRGSADMFGELLPLILRHGFAIPPQVAAVLRALAALEGTLRAISPDIDLIEAARAHGRLIADEALVSGDLRQALESRLLSFLPALQRLPRRLDKLSQDLEQGRFTVNVRPFADRQGRGFVTDLVQQLVVALLAATGTLGAIILIASDTGPYLTPNVRLYAFFGYVLLFVAFVLALRALVLVFQRPDRRGGRR
jgi:ubiquinone biosynthesis protein